MSNGSILVLFPAALTLMSIAQTYLTMHEAWYLAELERAARPCVIEQLEMRGLADGLPSVTPTEGEAVWSPEACAGEHERNHQDATPNTVQERIECPDVRSVMARIRDALLAHAASQALGRVSGIARTLVETHLQKTPPIAAPPDVRPTPGARKQSD